MKLMKVEGFVKRSIERPTSSPRNTLPEAYRSYTMDFSPHWFTSETP